MVAHNKGDINERDLRDIQQFIAANHEHICSRWEQVAGACEFYC